MTTEPSIDPTTPGPAKRGGLLRRHVQLVSFICILVSIGLLFTQVLALQILALVVGIPSVVVFAIYVLRGEARDIVRPFQRRPFQRR